MEIGTIHNYENMRLEETYIKRTHENMSYSQKESFQCKHMFHDSKSYNDVSCLVIRFSFYIDFSCFFKSCSKI